MANAIKITRSRKRLVYASPPGLSRTNLCYDALRVNSMRRLAPFCLLLGYLLCGCGQNAAVPTGAFPPFYPEAQPFRSAIGLTQTTPLPQRITGLTVPHHLLAADLIAGAFALASGQVTGGLLS